MRIIYLFILIIAFTACRKSELEQIPSNEPPPDHTISSVKIGNYITRTYILTLGREPDSIEYNSALNSLLFANIDSASRRNFLQSIFTKPDYLSHLYVENNIRYLNNTDSTEFENYIFLFQLYLNDTTYQLQWPYLQYESDRLTALKNAYREFTDSVINISELQRRMCDNYFYDQINMGSANFVISSFQNMLNRNATNAEQQSGISMVEGNNAILFLQAGSSKTDYLNIMTGNDNYFEGQVILMYIKYLNRIPITTEMANGTAKYSSTNDYSIVQKDILSSNEFIGIQ